MAQHNSKTPKENRRAVGATNPAFRHGMRRSITYKSWACMIQRCTNPKNTRYRFYGARGITVCERWKDFANFLADMGERPAGSYSIDRIDPCGNYEPTNCRWATQLEQMQNTSKPRLKATFQEIADQEGLGLRAVYSRYYRGQPLLSTT